MGWSRLRLHRTSFLVLLLLALCCATVYAGAQRSADENERRLLRERADEVLSLLQTFSTSLETQVASSTVVAEVTGGDPARWAAEVERIDGDASDGAWVLYRRVGDDFEQIATAGAPAVGPGDDAKVRERIEAAAMGGLAVVGLYGDGAVRSLGVAAGRPGGPSDYVTYAELSLVGAAASNPSADPGSLANLSLTLHLGTRRSPEAEILRFGAVDPLDAEHVVLTPTIGSSEILLTVSSDGPLAGGLAADLPLIFLGLAAVASIAVVSVVELSLRRRDDVMRSLTEVEQKNEALDRALADQRRTEAARLELEHELRQSQRLEAVGQLAGGIAHDFNNLLAAISSYSELAIDDLEGHPSQPDIVEIRAAAKRGAALTRQLLLFSRHSVGEDEVLDLNGVVEGVIKLLHRTIGEDVRLRSSLAKPGAFVRGGASELEQVVMNLVVNSRDALSSHGTIDIATELVHVDESDLPGAGVTSGDFIRLTVTDDGPGMSSDVVSHAFEPFFTTKDRARGTGLGLATVYGIAQRAGGHARIESQPGHGTTVEVLLPASPRPEPATEAPQPLDEASTTRSGTVLLVEDESSVRAASKRMLERRGYTVVEAGDGPEAVHTASTTAIDILVTDVVMPGGINGRELADELRRLRPNLPIVYMSGYSADLLESRGLRDGSVLLEKPFTERELLDAISRSLQASVMGTATAAGS